MLRIFGRPPCSRLIPYCYMPPANPFLGPVVPVVPVGQLPISPMNNLCFNCLFFVPMILPVTCSCSQSPYYTYWVGHLKSGLYASILWASTMLALLVFAKNQNQRVIATRALFCGGGAALLGGAGISYLRLTWRMVRARVRI